jgi:hypothetical protein
LLHPDVKDTAGIVHQDPGHRRMRVILDESDNSITVVYLENGRMPGDFQFDTASVGIINADRDGNTASFRLLNCSPYCGEGTRNRTTVMTAPASWPQNMAYKLTPDPKEGPTWRDVYAKIIDFGRKEPKDTCASANCHGTLKGPEYIFSAAVLGQPPIDRPKSAVGCGGSTDRMIALPLVSIAPGRTTADPARSWFTDNSGGLWAMTDPGGGYAATDALMPYYSWCNGGSKGSPSLQDDRLKSIFRRWILRDTP